MKNFKPTVKVVDGHVYNLYSVNEYHDQMVAYAQMAKRFMNKPFGSPLDIVGNYDWHEAFPYEKFLFHDFENGKPLVDFDKASVIDFGCGPGRMVNRARKLFKQTDGIDISEYAIGYAREHFEGSKFYISSGVDVGDAPSDTYDIAFSTIAIQHIPCKTIRENIFKGLHNVLKPGGIMSIQVAYHPTLTAGVWSHDTEHASYNSDFWNAKATNGHADMVINEGDLETLKSDLEKIFTNVKIATANVSDLYANLNGKYHAPYWAQDWLFIQAKKA
jgi:SAM-dependent methyltransferase